MKCRRCKTNFDYDTYYGICPKCAAYNRPDGKDEMKEVMGEGAKAFLEEYHPPVMANGSLDEFFWQEETPKKSAAKNKKQQAQKPQNLKPQNPQKQTTQNQKQQKKTYQERLSNPYLDQTDKKKRKEKKRTGKKSRGIWKVLLVLGIILASLVSEMDEYDWRSLEAWVEEVLELTPTLGVTLDDPAADYSEALVIYGRSFSFGESCVIKPEGGPLSDEESLLIVPYYTEVTDSDLNSEYVRDCYLTHEGLFLRPVSAYALEEVYEGAEGAGTLDYTYDEGYGSLVFAGNFSGLEIPELNLSYRKGSEAQIESIYRIRISSGADGAISLNYEMTRPEESLENGYGNPSIVLLGDSYDREDYRRYEIRQEFENHDSSDLRESEMTLYLTDETGYEDIYIEGEEEYYSSDSLWYYKQKVLPAGEKGTMTTIAEISTDCRQLRAAMYLRDISKEWQASLE